MFSEIEHKAINEKLEQLIKVREGKLSAQELSDLITKRRVEWIEKHLDEMMEKYKGLSPEERAYRIVFLEHMKINPEHLKIIKVKNKIEIHSYNFCPYLEACNLLNMDTKFVCKKINESSVEEMIAKIYPNLKFSRNYENIRPHAVYCEEYIE